jgi:hypothetical protein
MFRGSDLQVEKLIWNKLNSLISRQENHLSYKTAVGFCAEQLHENFPPTFLSIHNITNLLNAAKYKYRVHTKVVLQHSSVSYLAPLTV